MNQNTPSTYTLYADQSAHLDWDWVRTFAQNYWYYNNGQGVNCILNTAISLAQTAQTKGNTYYYTICEMGFFRRFIETNPSAIAAIQALGDNFQVISGGVTSPDCLVCSGEAFLRNYLVGQTWLKATMGMTAKPHCWIPDDFGQGPELPVLLCALGFGSVGFSRLPGTYSWPNNQWQDQLVSKGLDFIWEAADGATVVAHWMNPNYAIGEGLENGTPCIKDLLDSYYGLTRSSPLGFTGSQTSFMYIPIDNDFSMPLDKLLGTIESWKNNPCYTNIVVQDGTFDQFITNVAAKKSSLQTLAPYNGTPYMTGYYASRPALKVLHYETVRALTAAEVIGLLTQPYNLTINSMLPTNFWDRIDQTWTDFAPSTHHDYICGTAPDPVYAGDQLPLLRGAAAAARSLRDQALNALAGMISGLNNDLLVANSLGFQRGGLAVIEGVAFPGGSCSSNAQVSAEGGILVYVASVPSFGYYTGSIGSAGSTSIDTATITPETSGSSSYTISNQYLKATISADAQWGIASLLDVKNNSADILSASSPGNDIVFYEDSGGIYQFGNETKVQFAPCQPSVTTAGAGLGAVVLESGPLRVRLRTEVEFQVNNETKRFIREYTLCSGDPYLRMTTTGAAPSGTSVMTCFPLGSKVSSITHGTGYHWTSVQPLSGFWGPPTFQATHDFLLPQDDSQTTLAGVYHAGMPAWAFDANGALIGCLLRNTPGRGSHGAAGTDPAPHTQQYALRVPTGLGAPETGQPLQEALGFHTPLLAALVPVGNPNQTNQFAGMLTADSASLAALPGGSPAVLTVAKPGSYDPSSLVLRLYQPTNSAQTLDVTAVPGAFDTSTTRLVTAAETDWNGAGGVTPATDGGGFTINMANAVATVQICQKPVS